VHATLGGAQIARRRRSRSLSASSAPRRWSTRKRPRDVVLALGLDHEPFALINHAAGWLEGGLTASMEKLRGRCRIAAAMGGNLEPKAFTSADIALDAIRDVAPGGHFFGSDHTIARYETAFYRPLLPIRTITELAGFRRPRRHRPCFRDLEIRHASLCRARRWPRPWVRR